MSTNDQENVTNTQSTAEVTIINELQQQRPQTQDQQLRQIEEQPHPSQRAVQQNTSPIVRKSINDVIEFREPNTSNSYAFKTQIQISIIGEPKLNNKSVHSIDTELSFPMIKMIADEDSYTTVDECVKEKQTNTAEPTIFSQNDRTQVMLQMAAIEARNEPPPPYENRGQPPPTYTGRARDPPVYNVQPAQNAYRAPPYESRASDYAGAGGFFSEDFYSLIFLEREIRHNFIQKVYTILAVQLLFTATFVALAMFCKPVNEFVLTNLPCLIVSLVIFFILYLTLICYEAPRRVTPVNFILLAIFTLCLSYLTAFITVHYNTKVVLITLGSTAAVCTLVSILACQMSFDITKCGFIILMATLVVLVYGLIISIIALFTNIKVLFLVYCCLATVLFIVYLMWDTQMIMGGRSVSLSPEEYILGALTLYVDIVNIFILLLTLIGNR